jgi:hypothetical protein
MDALYAEHVGDPIKIDIARLLDSATYADVSVAALIGVAPGSRHVR